MSGFGGQKLSLSSGTQVGSDNFSPRNNAYSRLTRVNEKPKAWELAKWLSWKAIRNKLQKLLHHKSLPDETRYWKPATLQIHILGAVVLISISFIVVLEILHRRATVNGSGGGIVFTKDAETMPVVTKFSFLYLPTILAVFYSMLWSWVDLDAKRLEPWFQLSKPDGAQGSDSLLLHYPFDFLPFVPIAALRRRHWSVFYSGSVMLIVFWIITPLQSAIFNIGNVTRIQPTPIQTTSEVVPPMEQQEMLNSNFLNTAYGISWLGQKPPAFTTSEFALLPFRPSLERGMKSDSQSWSASTEIYSTSLHCNPAVVTREKTAPFNMPMFDNGRGCKTPIVVRNTSDRVETTLLYFGWYSDGVVDQSIGAPTCTEEHADNFLAIWSTAKDTNVGVDEIPKYTSIFCRPTYHMQEAIVTVNASDGSVASHELIGPLQDMPIPNPIFNTTNFEYIVGAGVPSLKRKGHQPDIIRPEPYPSAAKYNLTWPMPNAVGFGVSLNEGTIEDLKDPENLRRAFEKAHKLLFAVAFNVVTRQQDSASKVVSRAGTVTDTLGAVKMERSISIVVEAAFGVVIIMTILLWYNSSRRPSRLTRDPATISDVMSVIQDVDSGTDMAGIANFNFKLTTFDIRGIEESRLVAKQPSEKTSFHVSDDHTLSPPKYSHEALLAIRPLELRTALGLFFVGAISLGLAAVVFLEFYTTARNGIALPSKNSAVMSIIENFIPTIFATLLEPAWLILNRILCLLQPFDELRKGNAKPAASLTAKYTSLPPQLNVWRALRSGHIILATVCVIAVSTNVLAVALAGLIEQRSTTIILPMLSARSIIPRFDGLRIVRNIANAVYLDHFYAAQSNLTTGTPLPPWIDKQRFYFPFDLRNPRLETFAKVPLVLEGIFGSTTGMGVELTCYHLSADPKAENRFTLTPFSKDPEKWSIETFQLLPNGTRIGCGRKLDTYEGLLQGGIHDVGVTTSGASSLELLRSGDPQAEPDYCNRLITAGWFRLGAADATSFSSLGNRSLTHTFLACRPELKVANFDILVSPDGRILRSKQTSNFTTPAETQKYFHNATMQEKTFADIGRLIVAGGGGGGSSWHNDSFTMDWMNSLFMYKMGNDSIVNPASPVPDPNLGESLLKEMYTLLFSILLGLNTDAFERSPQKTDISLTILATEKRIFLEPIMFKITVVLLGLQLIVAVLYYTNRPRRFLTRMPTTIASIMALVSHSRALDDFWNGGGGESGDDGIEEKTYGYGRFVGRDGKTHVGIEKMRWIVPLESENPEAKKEAWWKGLRFRGERQKEHLGGGWI